MRFCCLQCKHGFWTMDYKLHEPWKLSNVIDIGYLHNWSPSLVAQHTTSDSSSSPMIHYSWIFFSCSFMKMQVLKVHSWFLFFSYHEYCGLAFSCYTATIVHFIFSSWFRWQWTIAHCYISFIKCSWYISIFIMCRH